MLHIDIRIHRPGVLALALLCAGGFIAAVESAAYLGSVSASGTGGTEAVAAATIHEAEEEGIRARTERAVLERRETILREQLRVLETDASVDPETVRDMRQDLLLLLQDKREAEERIRASLFAIWEAQGFGQRITADKPAPEHILLRWPVLPERGISAHYHDAAYEARFGLAHEGIDIPVAQGSLLRAAANGTVAKVTDNGMGFSSVLVDHGGYATLYGHVSGFLVHEGQQVRAGEPIALSGGMPGTQGAGTLTTGPHLHFELIVNGEHEDPLPYLPRGPLDDLE